MRIVVWMLFAATLASAQSFDCSKAQTAVERQICASPALRKLDEQMAAAYARLKAQAPQLGSEAQKILLDAQRTWLSERSDQTACQGMDKDCLQESYRLRLQVFTAAERVLRFMDPLMTKAEAFSLRRMAISTELPAEVPVLMGNDPPVVRKVNRVVLGEVFRGLVTPVRGSGVRYVGGLVNGKILSLYTITSENHGGAHPNHVLQSANIDLATGQEYDLTDVFKPGINPYPFLSQYVHKDLARQIREGKWAGDDSFVNPGAQPNAESFRVWILGEHELVLIFPPYQVGPYAAGIGEVHVPVKAMGNLLRPLGPLQ